MNAGAGGAPSAIGRHLLAELAAEHVKVVLIDEFAATVTDAELETERHAVVDPAPQPATIAAATTTTAATPLAACTRP